MGVKREEVQGVILKQGFVANMVAILHQYFSAIRLGLIM